MILKNIIVEDFVQYKKPSLFIGFPHCTLKCDKENGIPLCQNSFLLMDKNIEISVYQLLENYYYNNPITSAIVCGGMEPFDSWGDLLELVSTFRQVSEDDIVIYTGYKEEEIPFHIGVLKLFPNIIVKFGRFLPSQEPHLDEILGVKLVSSNQYARKIS